MDTLSSHPDDEFDVRFRETREAIRAELAQTGEQRTIRRTLDDGCPLQRGALLTLLGHGKTLVLKVNSHDDAAARACDARVQAFLKGLVGDGPRLGAETLRPSRAALDATPNEELAILNTADAHATLQVEDHSAWPTHE
jgi:hypothetical protein